MPPRVTPSGGEPAPCDGLAASAAQARHPVTSEGEVERVTLAAAAQRRLECGADLAGLGYYEIDHAAGVSWMDEGCRDICGYPTDWTQDLDVIEFWVAHMHPEDRPRVLEARRRLNEGEVERAAFEYRFLHPTSGERWFDHLARVMKRDALGRAVVTFGVLRDVTESRRASAAVVELTRRLLGAHEDQRALLARELHDDVIQRLAALAIEAGRAELSSAGAPSEESIRGLRQELVRLAQDVHRLAYELHPTVLDELGLEHALRTLAERLGRAGVPALSLELEPVPVELAPDAALCLYRVAQEALRNVTRHAGARCAVVALHRAEGGVLLSVHDDGAGFEPGSPRTEQGLGFASMRERVQIVNGTLDIRSVPGRGTTVAAWVPAGGPSR